MASYSVALQPSAEKDLRKIPTKQLERIAYELRSTQHQILVYYVRHRSEVYRQL